jgi:PEP-CTERM motif
MLHKVSILALLSLAAAFLVVAPANADGVPAHLTGDLERDADSAPHYSHDAHIGEGLKLNAGRFSTFDRDELKGGNSDFVHGMHQFSSGVPNTAEWIWWLNHSDNREFTTTDPPSVTAPEPASLLLLGSGVLVLGAWRRRANHSAPIS